MNGHDAPLRAKLRAIAERHLEGDPSVLATDFVATLDSDDVRELATACAVAEIKHAQRMLALRVEMEAERAAERASLESQRADREARLADHRARMQQHYEAERARARELAATRPARRQAEAEARRERLIARIHREMSEPELPERAPGILDDLFDRVVEVRHRGAWDGRIWVDEHQTTRRLTARETEIAYTAIFRLTLGASFDAWYRRALDHFERLGRPSYVALFRRRWEPDFVSPAYLADDVDLSWQQLQETVTKYRDGIRLEVTAELLATTFALGDGSRVTWGDATVEQHTQRVEMLLASAGGTIETAGRHSAAIQMIEAHGATCLRGLVEQAA